MGIPVLSVDYRLAPENPFSTLFNDGLQVYFWVLKYAKQKLGINPKKIILSGDSSGGHICIAITTLCLMRGIKLPHAI